MSATGRDNRLALVAAGLLIGSLVSVMDNTIVAPETVRSSADRADSTSRIYRPAPDLPPPSAARRHLDKPGRRDDRDEMGYRNVFFHRQDVRLGAHAGDAVAGVRFPDDPGASRFSARDSKSAQAEA